MDLYWKRIAFQRKQKVTAVQSSLISFSLLRQTPPDTFNADLILALQQRKDVHSTIAAVQRRGGPIMVSCLVRVPYYCTDVW